MAGPLALWRRNAGNAQSYCRPYFSDAGRSKEVIALSPHEEDRVVPFSGIVDPEQLALLTAAVDDYCREAGIDLSVHPPTRLPGLSSRSSAMALPPPNN